jgi:hypothetical protein
LEWQFMQRGLRNTETNATKSVPSPFAAAAEGFVGAGGSAAAAECENHSAPMKPQRIRLARKKLI